MIAKFFSASDLTANSPAFNNLDMGEAQLVGRIKRLANDPRRRTSMAHKFQHLPNRQLPAPVAPGAVKEAETLMGFRLPDLLCKLLTQVGNGGFGPGCGLFGVDCGQVSEFSLSVPHG